MQKIRVGDKVTVKAAGDFQGYTGTVHHITQAAKHTRPFIWLVFDDHPWQRKAPDATWSFTREELSKVVS